MCSQGRNVCKGKVAFFTYVLTESLVHLLMVSSQIDRVHEGFFTIVARIWPLSCVCSEMYFQVAEFNTRFATELARKGAFTCMYLHMFPQIACTAYMFSTLVTINRIVFQMTLLMLLQSNPVAE